MPLTRREQIVALEARIATLTRNRNTLEQQAANYGLDLPLRLVNELEQVKRDLVETEAALERLRAAPHDDQPYLGLATFQEGDAHRFFGRDALIAQLVEQARQAPFLAVLGPSGSGKSSVVLAGLLPALKSGALPGSEGWRYLPPLRPGARPLDALAATLTTAQGGDLSQALALRQTLLDQPRALLLAADLLGASGAAKRLVLVIDQAEELWSLAPANAEARTRFVAEQLTPFLQLLVTAIDEPASPLLVVLTMRADFLHRAAEHAELAQLLAKYDAIVSPMGEAQFRAVIERPAENAGGQFEPGLVDALVDEVTGQPGALPLLEYTLSALWQQRTPDNTMTWSAYRALGGVEGALAARADALVREHYAAPERLQALRGALLQLVQPGEGTPDTRRRTSLDDLVPAGGTAETTQALLQPLIAERLLTSGSEETDEATLVELSHEALIRAWPTLSGWINEARADLRLRLQLDTAAREWHANGQRGEFLWSGLRLANVEAWRRRSGIALNAQEERFVATSNAATRRARNLRAALIAVIGVLVAAGISAVVLGQTQRAQEAQRAAGTAQTLTMAANAAAAQANQQARRAERQASAAEALFTLEQGNADRALLLARAAVITDTDTVPLLVNRALRTTLQRTVPNRSLVGQYEHVVAVAWSPNGQQIFVGGDNGTAQIWDTASGQPLHTLEGSFGLHAGAWSPDGQQLLTGYNDGTAWLWDAATGQPLHTLEGHTSDVYDVAWSPDGRLVLTGSGDKTARIWDAATGQLLHTLDGHTDGIGAVAWSPNGQQVLTGSRDRTARVWDVATGKLLHTLEGHNDTVYAVAWSPDGRQVLTGGEDSTPRVWDAATGKLLHTLEGHNASVYAVAWSPDGQQVLTGSEDYTARVWDAATGELLQTLEGHSHWVYDVAWSPDGRQVLTGSNDGTARVWDAATGELLQTLEGHTKAVFDVAWSPDGRQVLTGSDDSTARVWDLASGQPLHIIKSYSIEAGTVAWSPDGRQVLTGSDTGTARMWDAATGQQLRSLKGQTATRVVAWSPDGRQVLTGSLENIAQVWDAVSGQPLHILDGHTAGIYAAAWSPDGRQVLTGSDDKTARVWDAASGQLLHTLEGHTDTVYTVAWSPDGRQLLTSSGSGTTRLWDAASGRLLHTLEGNTGAIYAVSWSPDGRKVLAGSYDDNPALWDAATGQLLHTLDDPVVETMAWSPDGRQVLTGSNDGTARLWDATSGHLLHLLKGHTNVVSAVAWSPDGRQVLTGSWDKTARIWDAASGEPLDILEGHADRVEAVAWSPDGQQLLTNSSDFNIRLWLAPSRLLAAELTRRLCYLNAFSEDELRKEIPGWRGCPAELAAVADALKEYDALRPRQ